MTDTPPTTSYERGETEPLAVAIVNALSKAKGRDISKDECLLYDSINTDALNELFKTDRPDDTLKVEFTTHGAIVIIWDTETMRIDVQDLEADPNYG